MKENNSIPKDSNAEYVRVSNELLQSKEMAMTNGHQLVSMMLVYLAAIIAVVSNIITNQSLVMIASEEMKFCIPFITFLFSVPIFLVRPASLKYHDMIRVMVSLAAYTRVYYELPSMVLNDNQKTQEKNPPSYMWGNMHLQGKIPNAKFIGAEFSIIAAVAFTIAIVFSIILLRLFSAAIWEWLMVFVFFGVDLYWVWRISVDTDTERLFDMYPKIYIKQYLQQALENHFLTVEEIEYGQNVLTKEFSRDTEIDKELRLQSIYYAKANWLIKRIGRWIKNWVSTIIQYFRL